MNKQRERIYGQRNSVLDGDDISEQIKKMITGSINDAIDLYITGDVADEWDFDGLRNHFMPWLTTADDFKYSNSELDALDREDIRELMHNRALKLYETRENEFGSEMMRKIERFCLLRVLDTNWMDHIDAMDELRRGIYLRAYGQHDPVVEYRNEGYDMFNAMIDTIRENTAKMVLAAKFKVEQEVKNERVATETAATSGDQKTAKTPSNNRGYSKNGLCPCGSGKKYKRCCGKDKD